MALIMIWTGMARVVFWSLLLSAFLLGLVWHPLGFVDALYALVAFTAAISTVSLIETAWSQVAASFAQLTAGDAHHDAEQVRHEVGIDFERLEEDIRRLADLSPGEEAQELAASIRGRLHR